MERAGWDPACPAGTRAGQRLDHVGVEDHLAPHGLDVDDRRLTRDGDRFLQVADAQLDRNRQHLGAAELDVFTRDDVEALRVNVSA